jgi:hypothetical protein
MATPKQIQDTWDAKFPIIGKDGKIHHVKC